MANAFLSGAFRRRTGNLPTDGTSFVGRRQELDRLAGLLSTTRLVTLTGVGGVGKTRLALAAGAENAHRFRDGVWLVQLSTLADGDLLAHTVAGAIRLTDQTTRPQIDVLTDHLAGRRLLLVLDTCEHLVDACADLSETLLRAAPGVSILAVSRQSLDAAGECVLALAPLSLPRAAPQALGATASAVESEAVTLFIERAAAVRPGFAVADEDRAAVVELCTRLEGIPLAIELAAAHLRTMSVRQILEGLDDRFMLLDAGRRTFPARHRRLLTTIGWSHELCTNGERLAWARLSVFPGTFDLEAARAVCADENLPADGIQDLLDSLIDKSIVLADGPGGSGQGARYRMLDTVRDYGARWLAELGQARVVRRRFRDHYLRVARRGEEAWFGPDQAGWFLRMSLEHANVRAALEASLGELGDPDIALDLAGTLWFFWVGAGHLAEGRHYLGQAQAASTRAAADPIHTKALWVGGYIAVLQGDIPAAVAMLERCRALAKASGDARAEAYAVHRLGCAALIGDDHVAAASLFANALARYAALDELNSNVVMARIELAMTAAFSGDLHRAVALCEQARAICQEHGERWALAYALYVLAFAAFMFGEREQAASLTRECLQINHAFHDLVGTVLPIELLALFAATEDAAEHAAVLQGAAGQIWKTVGMPLFGSTHFGAPHQQCRMLADAALGPSAYEAAYSRGTRLDLDEAVAYALSQPVRTATATP